MKLGSFLFFLNFKFVIIRKGWNCRRNLEIVQIMASILTVVSGFENRVLKMFTINIILI